MEEMLDDTLEMEDDEQLEEEADVEVDKVLYEYTNGTLGKVGTVQTEVPVRIFLHDIYTFSHGPRQTSQEIVDEEETERAMESYRQQLHGLLSS